MKKKKKGEKQKREQRCAGAERFASGAYLFLELLGKPQTAARRSRENNPFFCKGIKRRRGREEKKKNSVANGTQCKTKKTASDRSDRLW